MRIIITGASGNIGSALLRRLTSDDHELVGMARRMPDAPGPYGGVEWVSVDLTQDSCVPTLEHTFAGGDAVVHLAWGFQPSHDPAYLKELGVGGTRRVLCQRTAGLPCGRTVDLPAGGHVISLSAGQLISLRLSGQGHHSSSGGGFGEPE